MDEKKEPKVSFEGVSHKDSPKSRGEDGSITLSDPAIKRRLSDGFVKEVYHDSYKCFSGKIDRRLINHIFQIIIITLILLFSFYKVINAKTGDDISVWIGFLSSIFGFVVGLTNGRNQSTKTQ
jgi:hypothetical protein